MSALILALLEEHKDTYEVKTCLEKCGHEVTVVDSFLKAMEVIANRKIDLIISDVHLQNGGSVFDFLRFVKKSELTREIPFVLFSSQPTPMAKYLADGVRTSARALGAIKYIEMEIFNPALFQENINSLLPAEKQTAGAERHLKIVRQEDGESHGCQNISDNGTLGANEAHQ